MYFKKLSFVLLILTTSCMPNRTTPQPMPAVHFLVDNPHAKFLWSNYHPTTMLVSAPDRTIASGNSFNINAFDPKTGQAAWEAKREESISEMVVQDSVVYATKHRGLTAWDAKTGDLIWDIGNLDTGNAQNLFVGQQYIFVQHQTGKHVAIVDLSGKVIMALDTSSNWHTLSMDDNVAYYTDGNGLNALDIHTNQNKWMAPIENLRSITSVVSEDLIYLDSERLIDFDSVIAVDKHSGDITWKREKYEKIISNLCLLDENIYFLNAAGFLIALDKTNGQEVARLEFTNIPFVLYRSTEPQVSRYLITADTKNRILVIAFGDSFQLMAIQPLSP